MQVILKSTDRPLVETVRATLEAEGIDVLVEGGAVTALPFLPMSVLVADNDAALAQDLVRELVRSPSATSDGSDKRWARLVLVALLILFLLVCGSLLIG